MQMLCILVMKHIYLFSSSLKGVLYLKICLWLFPCLFFSAFFQRRIALVKSCTHRLMWWLSEVQRAANVSPHEESQQVAIDFCHHTPCVQKCTSLLENMQKGVCQVELQNAQYSWCSTVSEQCICEIEGFKSVQPVDTLLSHKSIEAEEQQDSRNSCTHRLKDYFIYLFIHFILMLHFIYLL